MRLSYGRPKTDLKKENVTIKLSSGCRPKKEGRKNVTHKIWYFYPLTVNPNGLMWYINRLFLPTIDYVPANSRINEQTTFLGCLGVSILLLLSPLLVSVIQCFDGNMEAKINDQMHGLVNQLNHDYPIPDDNGNNIHILTGHEEDDNKLLVADIEENNGQYNAQVEEKATGSNTTH
jgi:hypothetical protein